MVEDGKHCHLRNWSKRKKGSRRSGSPIPQGFTFPLPDLIPQGWGSTPLILSHIPDPTFPIPDLVSLTPDPTLSHTPDSQAREGSCCLLEQMREEERSRESLSSSSVTASGHSAAVGGNVTASGERAIAIGGNVHGGVHVYNEASQVFLQTA